MTTSMIEDNSVVTALGHWDLGNNTSVRRHGQGMNSATWLVSAEAGRWIAKAVPAAMAAQFEAGLVAAAWLEAAGLPAGTPLATRTGALSVAVAGCQLALLRYAAGRELDPTDPAEQRLWGATLARAHSILQALAPPTGVQGWHLVEPTAPHLDVEVWVRPAVQAAVERLQALQESLPLTYGLLHADPAPEAFLVDPRGDVAIIDWGSVTWGPLLYDLASARLFAGNERIFSNALASYLDVLPLQPAGVAALPNLLRFRWAVQADYFARRIWSHDLTGITEPSENDVGLADARHFLIGG